MSPTRLSLPAVPRSAFNKRRSDIWCSCQQLLHLAGGDHEEHAHLLAGTFLTAGHEAYVVLGSSLAGATAAYVLTTGRRADGREEEQQGLSPSASSGLEVGTSGAARLPSLHEAGGGRVAGASSRGLGAQQGGAGEVEAEGGALAERQMSAAGAGASGRGQWQSEVAKLRLWNPLTGELRWCWSGRHSHVPHVACYAATWFITSHNSRDMSYVSQPPAAFATTQCTATSHHVLTAPLPPRLQATAGQ